MIHSAAPVGTRVRLTRDVERFPHFIARKGMTGTVVNNDERESTIVAVRMDEHLPGCEEWDNEIWWDRSDPDECMADDLEYTLDQTGA